MTKLQISLTDQEALALGRGASNLGYSLTKFVKFLLGQKALEFSREIPRYKLSKQGVDSLKKSMKKYKEGEFTKVKSLMELVD